jgi:uroporphyrinogen decarboxylase
MEIDFQLHEELLGRRLLLGVELGKLQGKEKEAALKRNAEIYTETAYRLDLSAITVHPPAIECSPGYIPPWSYPDIEDELKVISMVRDLAADNILVAMGIDGTYGIPEGDGFEEFLFSFFDSPQERKAEAQQRVEWAVEIMKRMIHAGAEVMYNCSDYCFNSGPFISPKLFEEFIFPYLQYQVQELRSAGAMVIKHTDGNILPILDMLVESGPHAIHSIDPIAGMDIGEIKTACQGKVALMGNVNAAYLQTGPLESVEESAEYALKNGMPGGGYIFSSCNSIFEGIPLENYLAMLEVREKQGFYAEEKPSAEK